MYSGKICKVDGSEKLVAIKTLKPNSSDASKSKFLQEAYLLAQFKNSKIVALIGVVTQTEPTWIVLEYMEMGSLLSYLQNPMIKTRLMASEMTRFACQICAGMYYLGEKGFIHRDLAARNVLINKLFVCKIADFGLSQNTTATSSKGDKIPVRWTAPEAIRFNRYSTASDVWSYGVVLYEVWTYADTPYGTWDNQRIIREVDQGYRLAKPKKCSSNTYALMLQCWSEEATDRPSFYDCFHQLLRQHKSNITTDSEQGLYQSSSAVAWQSDDDNTPDQYLYMPSNEQQSDDPPKFSEGQSDNYLDGSYMEPVFKSVATKQDDNDLDGTYTEPGSNVAKKQDDNYLDGNYLEPASSQHPALSPTSQYASLETTNARMNPLQSEYRHLQLGSSLNNVDDQRERSSSDLQYARNDARNDDNTPQSEYSHLQLASGLSVDDQRERLSYRLQQSEYDFIRTVGASNYDTVDDFGAISQHLQSNAMGLGTPLVNETYSKVQVAEGDAGFGFPLSSLNSEVVNANDDDGGYLVL